MPPVTLDPARFRPFDARMLSVGDGHWLFVEEVGRRGGVPAVFLHGGPGSGAQHGHRGLFDPDRHHALLFDQRGAGRSHPYLGLEANTTAHLVADIEAIRRHFGIERWIVVGGSWGSTLAIAYAETHPERVAGLVMRAVFLGTAAEVRWAFVDGPRLFRPELHVQFLAPLDECERHDPLAAYLDRLAHADPAMHAPAARIWHAYERTLSELVPETVDLAAAAAGLGRLPPTPFVEAHYIRNDFFLAPDQLLRDAHRLAGIPGAIIQGRYDLLCPPAAAHAVVSRWTGGRLTFVEAAGHAMTEAGVIEAMREAITELTAG
ncbi:MAG: prolyl aminopeptidase [Hyphomicrobium sp.]